MLRKKCWKKFKLFIKGARQYLPSFLRAKEPVDHYGHTLSTYIDATIEMLERDAVGLWQGILYLRKDFELTDTALIDAVRKWLLALLKEGAEPVVAAEAGNYGWRLANYGKKTKEKAASIIQEWLDVKEDPSFWTSLWFILPHHMTKSHGTKSIDGTHLIKSYPGELYELPDKSGYFGVRMNHRGQKIIEFSHMPGYPAYVQIYLSQS